MKSQKAKTGRKRNASPRQSEPVEVYCRIRPLDDPNEPGCVNAIGDTIVQLLPPENALGKNGQLKEYQFTFQHVFDEFASQKAVFDYIALPLVEDLVAGKNGLLFTYGITGSGKTYTMTGRPEDQGILPRCLDVIFNSIGQQQASKYVFRPDRMNGFEVQSEADAMLERQKRDIMPNLTTPSKTSLKKMDSCDTERITDVTKVDTVEEDNNYAVFVSYIEIYNNYVYDLLEELPYNAITGYKLPQTKLLRTDPSDNMYVHNCTEVEVKQPQEAIDVFYKGQRRRKVAHTTLNAESSRSHSVFNIRLVQAPLDDRGEQVVQDPSRLCVSQLSLVDLAGSERTNRTKNSGDRLKEAGNINQSLLVLRTCLEILRENQKAGANKVCGQFSKCGEKPAASKAATQVSGGSDNLEVSDISVDFSRCSRMSTPNKVLTQFSRCSSQKSAVNSAVSQLSRSSQKSTVNNPSQFSRCTSQKSSVNNTPSQFTRSSNQKSAVNNTPSQFTRSSNQKSAVNNTPSQFTRSSNQKSAFNNTPSQFTRSSNQKSAFNNTPSQFTRSSNQKSAVNNTPSQISRCTGQKSTVDNARARYSMCSPKSAVNSSRTRYSVCNLKSTTSKIPTQISRCNAESTASKVPADFPRCSRMSASFKVPAEVSRCPQKSKPSVKKLVPYRDSRLTHLFKNFFDGEGKVRMIVCVNPKVADYEETIHVMKFAELTQEVVTAKPEEKSKFDIGMTPGRRRMHQEQLDKLEPIGIPMFPTVEFTVGPPFPLLELLNPTDDMTIRNIVLCLTERMKRKREMAVDYERTCTSFRSKLVELEQNYIQARNRLQEVEERSALKEKEAARLDSKNKSLERKLEERERLLKDLEKENQLLSLQVQDKAWKIQVERNAKEKLKNDYQNRIQMNNQAWEKNLEKTKRKLEVEAECRLDERDRKLDMLRDIVNENECDTPVLRSRGHPQPTPKPRTYTTPAALPSARSESDMTSVGSSTIASSARAATGRAGNTRVQSRNTVRIPAAKSITNLDLAGVTPSISKSRQPIVNHRSHRRSKSSGSAETWLEHKPTDCIETNTLFQPTMTRKKSVSKLDVKDTKSATKYVLTHQEQDSNDELVTKLIKGDVIPTVSGGSAVIFNDVEMLKQDSPGSRKRRSPTTPRYDPELQWTDTEERCSVALEGHSRKRGKITNL